MTDIEVGVAFPVGAQANYKIATYTRCVETLGFDSIWCIDVIRSGTQALDCLTALGFMAANSSKLRLGTSVLQLPLRNPILAAKIVSSLDLLSGGRVTLGIGLGEPASHNALGCDSRTRGRRCEEGLVLLKRLWTESIVSHKGEFYRLNGYTLAPKPVQSPHPPIWIGGHSEAAMARAARHADGFILIGNAPEHCGEKFDWLDNTAKAHGKGPLRRAAHTFLCFGESREAAARVGSETLTQSFGFSFPVANPHAHLLGTTTDCKTTLEAFRAAGVTHLILYPVCPIDEILAHVERFAKDLLDEYKSFNG